LSINADAIFIIKTKLDKREGQESPHLPQRRRRISCSHLNLGASADRLGNALAAGFKLLDVNFDALANCIDYFAFRFRGSGASWQIWHIGAISAFCFLHNDCVPHLSSLQSGLFEDASQRTALNIHSGMESDNYSALLCFVSKNLMAAFRAHQIPTIAFQEPDQFSRPHSKRQKPGRGTNRPTVGLPPSSETVAR
jgi:hypothetical protein